MDLSEVLQQDPNKLATSALNDMFGFQRQALFNENQAMQNDRYGQMTPLEVAKTKLEALRAQAMSDPESVNRYVAGALAQQDILNRSNRRAQAVDDAGINPELLKAQEEERKAHAAQMAQGIDEVTQLFAGGATPDQVYQHIAKQHGEDVAAYYMPVIKQGAAGVKKFHDFLLQTNPTYRTHIDQANVSGRYSLAAARERASALGGGGLGIDKELGKNKRAVLQSLQKQYQSLLQNPPMRTPGMNQQDYQESLSNHGSELETLQQRIYTLSNELQGESTANPTNNSPKVRTYNPATGKVE